MNENLFEMGSLEWEEKNWRKHNYRSLVIKNAEQRMGVIVERRCRFEWVVPFFFK